MARWASQAMDHEDATAPMALLWLMASGDMRNPGENDQTLTETGGTAPLFLLSKII